MKIVFSGQCNLRCFDLDYADTKASATVFMGLGEGVIKGFVKA